MTFEVKPVRAAFVIRFLAATLFLSQVALAQSGRRTKKPDSAPPAPMASEPANQTAPARISSIIIGGQDIDPDTKQLWSNYTSIVVKSCTERLKERPGFAFEVINGGTMTRTAAVERAKRETEVYVLWFGYRSKLVGLEMTNDYIDYLVLMPQSAKTLTEGRVYPWKQRETVDPGGILRVPKRRSRVEPEPDLLRKGGREIADRVRGKL